MNEHTMNETKGEEARARTLPSFPRFLKDVGLSRFRPPPPPFLLPHATRGKRRVIGEKNEVNYTSARLHAAPSSPEPLQLVAEHAPRLRVASTGNTGSALQACRLTARTRRRTNRQVPVYFTVMLQRCFHFGDTFYSLIFM